MQMLTDVKVAFHRDSLVSQSHAYFNVHTHTHTHTHSVFTPYSVRNVSSVYYNDFLSYNRI